MLAELETASIPSNLSITGVEYNQAIQFFRSELDPATARPDNSIGLIAGKNTILRVYVDTQTDPSRPTIASVSGLLEIRLPGGATWNPTILLNREILPKRDSAISRSNANDTLNFFIPGPFCRGNVDYRVRVFDVAHPDRPGYTSGRVQGTLQFTQVEPLRVRGVGVHFTGMGLDIAAPNVAALRDTLIFVQKTYPVGQVFITGFDVIDYDGDFTDTSGDGCGSGWDGLLDRLRDMQGDSNDIYYGLVPSGVPTGGTIGCGGGDGRVSAGFVNDGSTAAQEIGHALERDHAPCGNPGNVDANYPVYDALPSGSIGEFGMDDNGNLQDPATVTDFMSHCSPNWVSPYTYEALRQNFSAVSARRQLQALQPIQQSPERRFVPSENLFLNFRIFRRGKVEVFPSFHYRSLPIVKSGRWTPYAIELRDRHNRVLQAHRVELTDPHKDLDSAALDFFKPIPFHKDTARVAFTCDADECCQQKELLTVDIANNSPKVRIVSPIEEDRLSGIVRVAWEASYEDKPLHDLLHYGKHKPLNYLLRYSNDGGQSWRAVAPRLQVTEYIVDLDRLPGGERCQFQVLATEGIRTGVAVSEPFQVPQKPRVATIVSPASGTAIALGQTVTFIGESFSPDTGSAPPAELQWDSDVEGSLGVGQEINIRTLRPGLHNISLRTPDGLGGESVASIQIEVQQAPIPLKHTSLTYPDHTSTEHDLGQVPSKPEGGSQDGN